MRVRVLLAITATALLVTACGGGGDSAVTAYRAAANVACRKQRSEIVALAALSRRRHLDAAELTPRLRAISARVARLLFGVRGPASLAAARNRLWRDVSHLSQTVTSGGVRAIRRVMQREHARAKRIIADERALGLNVCAQIVAQPPPKFDA